MSTLYTILAQGAASDASEKVDSAVDGAVNDVTSWWNNPSTRDIFVERPVKILLILLVALVLDRLAAEGFGRQPPVAYRALEFLVEHGLAHRLQRLNAFAACLHPGHDHAPAFLICRECDMLAELPAAPVRDALTELAAESGFQVERATIEALGLCPACAGAARARQKCP